MTEQEARDAVVASIEAYASEEAEKLYHSSEGVGPYRPDFTEEQCDFTSALDAYRDAVLAAQPCYRDGLCNELPPCPTCQARERMTARAQVTA